MNNYAFEKFLCIFGTLLCVEIIAMVWVVS